MKRIWTIIGVRDVLSCLKWYQSLFGQPATPPAHDDFGTNPPTQMELFCFVFTNGAIPWTSLLLDEPRSWDLRQRTPVVLPCRRFRRGASKGTLSRSSIRRGATRESEHANQRILAASIRKDITSRSVRSPGTDKTHVQSLIPFEPE